MEWCCLDFVKGLYHEMLCHWDLSDFVDQLRRHVGCFAESGRDFNPCFPSRSISLPPAVRYADKAAERVSQLGAAEGLQLLGDAKKSGKPYAFALLDPAGLQGDQSMAFV